MFTLTWILANGQGLLYEYWSPSTCLETVVVKVSYENIDQYPIWIHFSPRHGRTWRSPSMAVSWRCARSWSARRSWSSYPLASTARRPCARPGSAKTSALLRKTTLASTCPLLRLRPRNMRPLRQTSRLTRSVSLGWSLSHRNLKRRGITT